MYVYCAFHILIIRSDRNAIVSYIYDAICTITSPTTCMYPLCLYFNGSWIEISSLAVIVLNICTIKPDALPPKIESATEYRRLSLHENSAWLARLSGLIYISGEERDHICNRRSYVGLGIVIATCRLCNLRGRALTRRGSRTVESRGRASRWKFNYSVNLTGFIYILVHIRRLTCSNQSESSIHQFELVKLR